MHIFTIIEADKRPPVDSVYFAYFAVPLSTDGENITHYGSTTRSPNTKYPDVLAMRELGADVRFMDTHEVGESLQPGENIKDIKNEYGFKPLEV